MKKKHIVVLLFIIGFVLLILLGFNTFFPKNSKEEVSHRKYEQQLSQIVLPININITSFEKLFNEQMEAQGYFYEDKVEAQKNVSLTIRIKKNGVAQLYPENGKIKLTLPMLIEIYPKAKGLLAVGLAKDTQLIARVVLQSDIDGSLHEDWSLNADTTSKFIIEETPQLSVLGFEVDFGQQLKDALEIGADEINQSINEQIKEVINTKEIINYVFEELKEPYKINEEPFETWADVDIQKVTAHQLKPAGPGQLNLTVKIDALFDIIAGAKPKKKDKKLPNVTFSKEDFGNYSILNFPLIVNKQAVVNYLNKEYSPTTFQVQGKKFTIGQFSLATSNHQFKMNAVFSYRGLEGQLEMSAHPILSKESQILQLSDIQIKSKSNQKIIDGALNTLQKTPQFKRTIEKKLQYSLQKDLADLTFHITKQLKETRFNEYSYLDGYLNHIAIKDVFIAEHSFLFNTEIKAAAVVKVEALD